MAASALGLTELASRYAAALFDLADEARELDTVAADLQAFRDALAASADLERLVLSPVLTRAEQGRAIDAVLTGFGASALTRKFLGYIASQRRLFVVKQIIARFLEELARRRGEITATVVTAQALSEEQTAALTDQIKKQVGARVNIDISVDPALLGGLVVRVGSRMVDTSLQTKLRKLETAMKGAA